MDLRVFVHELLTILLVPRRMPSTLDPGSAYATFALLRCRRCGLRLSKHLRSTKTQSPNTSCPARCFCGPCRNLTARSLRSLRSQNPRFRAASSTEAFRRPRSPLRRFESGTATKYAMRRYFVYTTLKTLNHLKEYLGRFWEISTGPHII